jgi:hypothetical protein
MESDRRLNPFTLRMDAREKAAFEAAAILHTPTSYMCVCLMCPFLLLAESRNCRCILHLRGFLIHKFK